LISGNAGPRRRRQNPLRRCAWRAAATDREVRWIPRRS